MNSTYNKGIILLSLRRALLTLAGIFGVIMGIIACYGICSALGLFFGPMHSVLPFLLLGIGIDDMFVIVQVNTHRSLKSTSHLESNDYLCTKPNVRASCFCDAIIRRAFKINPSACARSEQQNRPHFPLHLCFPVLGHPRDQAD